MGRRCQSCAWGAFLLSSFRHTPSTQTIETKQRSVVLEIPLGFKASHRTSVMRAERAELSGPPSLSFPFCGRKAGCQGCDPCPSGGGSAPAGAAVATTVVQRLGREAFSRRAPLSAPGGSLVQGTPGMMPCFTSRCCCSQQICPAFCATSSALARLQQHWPTANSFAWSVVAVGRCLSSSATTTSSCLLFSCSLLSYATPQLIVRLVTAPHHQLAVVASTA